MELATTIPADLAAAAVKVGLALADNAAIAAAFAPHFVAFRDAADRSAAVLADQPKAARTLRLELRGIRTQAEATRKRLKEDSLRRGQAIDGIQRFLEHALVPVEEAMEAIERAEERREAARVQALQEARKAELAPFADPSHYLLGTMPEDQWQQLLAGAKAAKTAADDAARQAEAKRVADEASAKVARDKADAERLQREQELAAENARLAKVAADAQAETNRANAEAAAERKRAVAVEVEARRISDAAAAKAAKEQADAEAAARAFAAAPDRDKLRAFAVAIRALPVPMLATNTGLNLLMRDQVVKFAEWVESRAAKL